MSRPVIAALLLASSLFACDPAWTIHGQVLKAAGATLAPEPLPGATVTLSCSRDEGLPAQVVQADEEGGFQLYGDGAGLRRDCEVSVEAPGYEARSFSLDQLCADGAGSRCATAALQAELSRKL